MPLTHVCVWDSRMGYRHIDENEAAEMYPLETVPAHSGVFLCELCSQNVGFTKPSKHQVRHFFHTSASQNKECEDRAQSYDRAITSLNQHTMPIRIKVTDDSFVLQLGFFSPSTKESTRPQCQKIKIGGDDHQLFEYAFERIESSGVTYLNIGNIPSAKYWLEYIQPSAELKMYWPSVTPGISAKGTFFDYDSGRMLQSGAKAYPGKRYYLLQRRLLLSIDIPKGISTKKLCDVRTSTLATWYLYEINVQSFHANVARFFLQRSIFLTESPAVWYPVWPPYIKDSFFIYHNENSLYFFMGGDGAELRTYPITNSYFAPQCQNLSDGKLYKIHAVAKTQLLSLGHSGALGFSYLFKKDLAMEKSSPTVAVRDSDGNYLDQTVYSTCPKGKRITISAPFDGRVKIFRSGKISSVFWLAAGQELEVSIPSLNFEVEVYQGCDRVYTVRFEKRHENPNLQPVDEELLRKLSACNGPEIEIPHSFGAMISRLSDYPRSANWVSARIRKGQMPATALKLLMHHIDTNTRRNHSDG